ncbi:hypothetical protein ABW19_dt0202945 [Dactylella cylindrospora]|nr:hypothetical protein ABW19_dt0202945 [Dactylella cylindrospora]
MHLSGDSEFYFGPTPSEAPDCTETATPLTFPSVSETLPIPIERAPKLEYDPNLPWELQTRIPQCAITARPPEHDGPIWPAHYLDLPSSPSEPRFSRSVSPSSFKRPAPAGDNYIRPKPPRMNSFKSDKSDEMEDDIPVKVPDDLREDSEIQHWCTELLQEGAILAAIKFLSLMSINQLAITGIKEGIKLFARKMERNESDNIVLNTLGVYLDLNISKPFAPLECLKFEPSSISITDIYSIATPRNCVSKTMILWLN